MLKTLSSKLLDFIYPPTCLACDHPVTVQGGLCEICYQSLDFVQPPSCQSCGRPFPFALDAEDNLQCGRCLANPPLFGQSRASILYEKTGRHLIHQLKYSRRLDLVPTLSKWMVKAGADVLEGADLLVPVPLHPWRLLRRHFNQAAVLAHEVARETGVPCFENALLRTKWTQPQWMLSPTKRAENVKKAFSLNPKESSSLAGKDVVLIDDVLTTGSTLEACANLLHKAKVARVRALVVAVTP